MLLHVEILFAVTCAYTFGTKKEKKMENRHSNEYFFQDKDESDDCDDDDDDDADADADVDYEDILRKSIHNSW